MPVFPKREAEILALAQQIIGGLTAGAVDFPAPPISVADLQAALDSAQSAEDAVAYDDGKLNSLGWAGKTVRSSEEPPGQAGTLEARQQGEGWLSLAWEAPADGGRVRSYRIERREHPEGVWAIAGMAVETKATLSDQGRGKEWEYRVIAVNMAGEGMPSNTVMAVL